jgi:hypothetical protein
MMVTQVDQRTVRRIFRNGSSVTISFSNPQLAIVFWLGICATLLAALLALVIVYLRVSLTRY